MPTLPEKFPPPADSNRISGSRAARFIEVPLVDEAIGRGTVGSGAEGRRAAVAARMSASLMVKAYNVNTSGFAGFRVADQV